MGLEINVDIPTGAEVRLDAAIDRGLLEAGAAVLALSNSKAPTEPDPRHGQHLTETGFVRAAIVEGEHVVIVGYEAFWAGWQEVHEDWKHPYGGEAKFLEHAVVEGEPVVLEIVAARMREAL